MSITTSRVPTEEIPLEDRIKDAAIEMAQAHTDGRPIKWREAIRIAVGKVLVQIKNLAPMTEYTRTVIAEIVYDSIRQSGSLPYNELSGLSKRWFRHCVEIAETAVQNHLFPPHEEHVM